MTFQSEAAFSITASGISTCDLGTPSRSSPARERRKKRSEDLVLQVDLAWVEAGERVGSPGAEAPLLPPPVLGAPARLGAGEAREPDMAKGAAERPSSSHLLVVRGRVELPTWGL